MLNSIYVIASESNVTVIAELNETFNVRTGDVDQKTSCKFFNKSTGLDIGYANIYVAGDHTKITGDFNGRRLVEKFDFLKK